MRIDLCAEQYPDTEYQEKRYHGDHRARGKQLLKKIIKPGPLKRRIMKIYCHKILLVVCFTMLFPGCVSKKDKITVNSTQNTDQEEKYYYDCVKDIKNNYKGGPIDIDFTKFRHGYFQTLQKDLLNKDNFLEKKLGDSLSNEEWEAVINTADKILDQNFTRIRAHTLKSHAYHMVGKESELNSRMASGLINSILSSGDGKRFETAFHVFRVEEEYDILKTLQLFPSKQALTENNGDMFDYFECEYSNWFTNK